MYRSVAFNEAWVLLSRRIMIARCAVNLIQPTLIVILLYIFAKRGIDVFIASALLRIAFLEEVGTERNVE